MKSHILIVEDEPAIAENIGYALKTEGFETTWFSEGKEVLSFLLEKKADLIVLDIGLPDVNGMELCKEIRKNHNIPIIFLTARNEEIDRVVGLEIGGDDYMVKPFSPRELTARIKAVLRRCVPEIKKPEKKPLAFTVDRDAQRITYSSIPLELSRYEYRILKTLIEKPGRIFTRDQLMEKGWDDPAMSMDRTVDVHIKNIRAKLKKITPEKDPIRTARGVGYALKENI